MPASGERIRLSTLVSAVAIPRTLSTFPTSDDVCASDAFRNEIANQAGRPSRSGRRAISAILSRDDMILALLNRLIVWKEFCQPILTSHCAGQFSMHM